MSTRSKHVASADHMIRLEKRIGRPHVVILGAGASLAAFPNGDANGKKLPLMATIVETLGLGSLLDDAGMETHGDFESIYSRLCTADPHQPLVKEIEQRVESYFGSLALPSHSNLYDLLILSLRDKDAIFTFNWDPFLVDAYSRHARSGIPLPQIFHLHGNVRASYCNECGVAMRRATKCFRCEAPLAHSPLLYPVEQKDYARNQFIHTQWEQVRQHLEHAFLVTIFGYRAPRTDQEAMAVLKNAWKGDRDRLVEHVEIIDIRSASELCEQWHDFSFHGHYTICESFYQSRLARYPRRSCESLYLNGYEGLWAEEIAWSGSSPASPATTLHDLRKSVEQLCLYEKESG